MKLFYALIVYLAAAAVCTASAQTYPARTITVVVPFAAGGAVEAIAEDHALELLYQLLDRSVAGASIEEFKNGFSRHSKYNSKNRSQYHAAERTRELISCQVKMPAEDDGNKNLRLNVRRPRRNDGPLKNADWSGSPAR